MLLSKVNEEVVPQRMRGEDFGISEDDESILGARHCNVEAPVVAQEPNSLLLVGAHAAENNVVFLATLKSVDAAHFHVRVVHQLEGPDLCRYDMMYARWPSYGVTMPTLLASMPARMNEVTIFSHFDASERFRYEVPAAEISSLPLDT